MPPAAEWSEDVLSSIHGELVSLARRIARLEEGPSPRPAPPPRKDDDPLGPLFHALESISSELTDFAERLAQLEDAGPRSRRRPRFPLLVISPGTSAAAVRAARSRRARKAVHRA